jgi:phosphate transport system substrate-binding protein
MTDVRNPARPARASLIAAATVSVVLGIFAASARADDITLAETGSTLLYPLFNIWASEYPKTHPTVKITTASTGSGAGIEQAISGAAQIGASDAYMSDAQIKEHPQIINVPMAIAAQTVNYNLPGLEAANLKLDGGTLAGIYSGKIRAWDDKAIVALNPNLKLPHNDIVPIHRSEASGETFVFTSNSKSTKFLGFANQQKSDSGLGCSSCPPFLPA